MEMQKSGWADSELPLQNSSLFSAVPDSSNMYQNKDSNLISDQR